MKLANLNEGSLALVLALALATIAGTATAQTWEENLEKGAADTEQNHLNVPFVEPDNWRSPYTTPGNWPTFENRGPLDRSPSDSKSKVLVMGTGDPTPNPLRYGPALAVIVNGIPTSLIAARAGGERWRMQCLPRTH